MKTRILLVEDDDRLANLTAEYLRKNDFEVNIEGRGDTAEARILNDDPELVILDVMLPGKDGFEVCRAVREKYKGVILMLTARDEDLDQILGLELGADDYIAKPCELRELMARIRAVLRRTSSDARKAIHFSEIEVDFERRIVKRKGEDLKLTPAEYNLLAYFLHNPDRALTRDMILNSVWGYEFFPNTRTVDAHVVKLRQKLEPDSNTPRHFLTVHGVGYRFLP